MFVHEHFIHQTLDVFFADLLCEGVWACVHVCMSFADRCCLR